MTDKQYLESIMTGDCPMSLDAMDIFTAILYSTPEDVERYMQNPVIYEAVNLIKEFRAKNKREKNDLQEKRMR